MAEPDADGPDELALLGPFVEPAHRARLAGLLASPRGRAKFRTRLAHFGHLDPRWLVAVPPRDSHPAGVEAHLRAWGAPARCYVVSEDPGLDGRVLPLRAALEAVVGRGSAAFVSCVPGELAYFEDEEPWERYLLVRPAEGSRS